VWEKKILLEEKNDDENQKAISCRPSRHMSDATKSRQG
jgi:hypothetical protein